MNIAIIGLGLIGGSMALCLRDAGHRVYGRDTDEVLAQAQAAGAIDGKLADVADADVVIIATPPAACVEILKKGGFRSGQIVTDVCGIKREIRQFGRSCGGKYVGCHPMAGREVGGFRNAQAGLFRGASMIITDGEDCPQAADVIEALSRQMGFGRIMRCSSDVHDQKIAYTSQLAHVVSNAYVKSERANGYLGFTGGSFQDMTRIAALNESLWTQLFMMNKDFLATEIRELAGRLTEYADALEYGDEKALCQLLKEGSARRKQIKWSKV